MENHLKAKWERCKNNKMAYTNASKWLYKHTRSGLLGKGRKICEKHAHFYMVYMLHGSYMSCIMSGIGSGRSRRGLCPTSIINIESRASASNERNVQTSVVHAGDWGLLKGIICKGGGEGWPTHTRTPLLNGLSRPPHTHTFWYLN